jgi:uncharacterized hydantoinase/oxoprolinase family protein
VASIKALPDGTNVALSGLIVTAQLADCIYAEESDRISGIKIITTKAVTEGCRVYVTGSLTTINGERAIAATNLEIYDL